ncbi:Rpn family recombination-promoting nuclease/putative transposase [Desulfococcaceae bacterium HSG9]|nr:Rpn family recombination-promoting nuclease/putative transposase [Desulfococcaceae bacterium HSG9]
MNNLLPPKLDLVFKMLFTKDDELLTDLLNAVLNLSAEKRIRTVKVLNPAILPETVRQKIIILDIRATDASDRQYDIEMQVRKYLFYPKRTLYYISKMYAEQLKAGDEYDRLKPVIGIHFLDYEQFPDYDDFHFCFQFREKRHPELTLTEDMTLHLFELPVFDKQRRKTDNLAKLEEWLWFFCHAHEEKEKTMRTHYANPKIQKAFDMLETLSADENIKILAEERAKALKDEISIIASERRSARREGERIGIEKGKIIGIEDGQKIKAFETARKLLRMGILSTEQIADATGLERAEIDKL